MKKKLLTNEYEEVDLALDRWQAEISSLITDVTDDMKQQRELSDDERLAILSRHKNVRDQVDVIWREILRIRETTSPGPMVALVKRYVPIKNFVLAYL